MKPKEYKVRNRDDAKIICSNFTSRIEVTIKDQWFVAVRVRSGTKRNPCGYKVEFYQWPNLLAATVMGVSSMEEARKLIKEKVGITMPKSTFDILDANRMAHEVRGKEWKKQ